MPQHKLIRSKEIAAETYQKALDDHQTAVLLEETTPDIFQIKVGQLKSGNVIIKVFVGLDVYKVGGNQSLSLFACKLKIYQ